jgi:hypothetical protein
MYFLSSMAFWWGHTCGFKWLAAAIYISLYAKRCSLTLSRNVQLTYDTSYSFHFTLSSLYALPISSELLGMTYFTSLLVKKKKILQCYIRSLDVSFGRFTFKNHKVCLLKDFFLLWRRNSVNCLLKVLNIKFLIM